MDAAALSSSNRVTAAAFTSAFRDLATVGSTFRGLL
jgi:hypothetical protein